MSVSAGKLEDLFYGPMISMISFGISITQAWTYLNTNRDGWAMRVWVATILILNLVQIVMVSQVAHYYLMPFTGIAMTSSSPVTLATLEWMLTGIIQIGVQLYFARVIYLFRKRIWIPAVIACLCVGLLVIMIHASTRLIVASEGPISTRIEMSLFHGGVVIVDGIIMVSMWNMFLPRNSFVLRTRAVLEKLIMYAVARGLLLTGAQAAHLMTVMLKPVDIFSWFPSQILLSNICVSTLLAILNARATFREMFDVDALPTFSLRFAETPTLAQMSESRSS